MVKETEAQDQQGKDHFENYLLKKMETFLEKTGTKDWVKKRFTFFQHDNNNRIPLEQIMEGGFFNGRSNITFDAEGRIFHSFWVTRKSIDKGSKIFGVLQKGRDYYNNPPHKQLRECKTVYIRSGVDVALRRSEEIRDRYRVEVGESECGEEARQMLDTLHFLEGLKEKASHIGRFNTVELNNLQGEITEFLKGFAFDRVQQLDKQKIGNMLLGGLLDRRKRKNYLVAMYKIFNCTLAARRRLEYDLPAVAFKYTLDCQTLEASREINRQRLRWAIFHTSLLLNSQTLWQENQQEEACVEKARAIYTDLQNISTELCKIKLRPYVLGARKTIEHLGTRMLPEGVDHKTQERKKTISRILQDKRAERGIPTVRDYLKQGDFTSAKSLIEQNQKILQKILDIHADYKTVKPSGRFKKHTS